MGKRSQRRRARVPRGHIRCVYHSTGTGLMHTGWRRLQSVSGLQTQIVCLQTHNIVSAICRCCRIWVPNLQKTEIKYHIRNQCVAAILTVLETSARSGVRCRLPSLVPGEEEEMILMPRLFSMNLDQPEAQLYFGMLNRW